MSKLSLQRLLEGKKRQISQFICILLQDGRMDRWMEGWILDKQMDRWIRWMDGWIDGQMDDY